MMDDRQQIYALYERMYKAMIAKDADVLRQVHAPDFVLVHMTGMRQTKPAFLKAVENGILNYASAAHDSMEVTISGDSATLIGKSRVNAAVFGGGWHTWRLEQDLKLEKKDGCWLITLSEASTY